MKLSVLRGEHVRRVVLRRRAVVDERSVLVQRVVVVGPVRERRPVIPAGWNVGRRLPVRAEVILAEEARPVAGRVQPGRERRGVVELALVLLFSICVWCELSPVRSSPAKDSTSGR